MLSDRTFKKLLVHLKFFLRFLLTCSKSIISRKKNFSLDNIKQHLVIFHQNNHRSIFFPTFFYNLGEKVRLDWIQDVKPLKYPTRKNSALIKCSYLQPRKS